MSATGVDFERMRAKHLAQIAKELRGETPLHMPYTGPIVAGRCRMRGLAGHMVYKHPKQKKYPGVVVCAECGQAMTPDGEPVEIAWTGKEEAEE